MSWWLIPVAWLVGWYYGARLALTWRMGKLQCRRGMHFLENCVGNHPIDCPSPVGELRGRNLGDGLVALGMGFAWPVLVLARGLMVTTPLTAGEANRVMREQERRITKQADEIERLERQIGGWPPR